MLELYPEFRDIRYFRTAEEAFEAVQQGEIDATCAPEQMARTGFHPGIQGHVAPPDSTSHVVCEVTHAYHCSLLVKPGTQMEQIRRVLGHTGSVTQSRAWLERHLPQAAIEIVDTSSVGAGNTVLAGDGSLASVGTPELARELGLEELARDIDQGSVGNYWAISREPIFKEAPARVIVAARMGGDGRLTALIGALDRAGYRLQTVHSRPSGQALFEHDYVLRFGGHGRLEAVQRALAAFESARLVGAFEARE